MKKILATLAVVVLAIASTQAQGLISYEGFAIPPYQAGISVNNAPNATANPTAWNGSWYNGSGGTGNNQIANGTLSYTDSNNVSLTVSDGHMNIIGNDRDARALPIPLITTISPSLIDGGKIGGSNASGTLYLSFLMTAPTNPGFAALELQDGFAQDSNRRFEIRHGPIGFEAKADLDGGGTIDPNDASVAIGIDPGANFFVVKFEFNAGANNDKITVWRNPLLGLNDDPNGTLLTSAFNLQFTDLAVANFSGGSFLFDEIRWGLTWDAVAIPEPSTYALIIGGALLLGIMIRRRNQRA
jgi:hypothetical protein